MSTSVLVNSDLTTKCINPLIISVHAVFETMLDCSPQRCGLTIKDERTPKYDLSAVIGVTGKAIGTIVVSLARETALNVLDRMIGVKVSVIDRQVRDALGELANMIAGQTKAKLERLELAISVPNIVEGRDHSIHYPMALKPIGILFESELGPFSIEMAFKESNLD